MNIFVKEKEEKGEEKGEREREIQLKNRKAADGKYKDQEILNIIIVFPLPLSSHDLKLPFSLLIFQPVISRSAGGGFEEQHPIWSQSL